MEEVNAKTAKLKRKTRSQAVVADMEGYIMNISTHEREREREREGQKESPKLGSVKESRHLGLHFVFNH